MAVVSGIKNLTIAGIPNCGKTTLFNGLTGARHRVGNWAGVTVEKIEGSLPLKESYANLIDLPGTYNLSPNTEDQRIAAEAISSGDHDLIINVVDASNLTRNLFLTQDILKRNTNVIVLLSMVDVAKQEGIEIDVEALSQELGVPVFPVVAVSKKSIEDARVFIQDALENPRENKVPKFPEKTQDIYSHIDKIYAKVVTEKKDKQKSFTDRIDQIVLNKWTAIPIFLLSMYLVFWFAISVGGAFIDFFDIMGGLLFVDGLAYVLEMIGSPDWVVALLAAGVGAGLQTVATFIPVIYFIFLALAILQDSGYMARLAVLADRFMRHIGLPGNAFIPMMVGFGCTVPAVMSARTLSTKRDRFMTIFMAPFMSCGARLPVYALFSAALFGQSGTLVVFGLYLLGIVMSVFTGILLRKTLFAGRTSNFVMDLPFYHIPRARIVLKSSYTQLKAFVLRAGTIIVIAVLILGFFNSMGYSRENGITFGNEDSEESVLTVAGRSLHPIVAPMGISQENWPATVALFTGLFAKEAIVGTVNSLYSGMAFAEESRAEAAAAEGAEVVEEEEEGLDFLGTTIEAFASIGDGLMGVVTDPDLVGAGQVADDAETLAEDLELDTAVFFYMKKHFTPISAFAYMIFVLLYFPCLAVVGAAQKEMGKFYVFVFLTYLTVLGWASATLFYQIFEGHNMLYTGMAVAVLALIYVAMKAISMSKTLAFKE